MNIKYRVISVDEREKCFSVRYYTDLVTEEFLNVEYDVDGDIIYDSNGYPLKCRTDYNYTIFDPSEATSENIHRKIITSAPVPWLEIIESNKTNNNVISLSNVVPLLGQENVFTVEEYANLTSTESSSANLVNIIENIVESYLNNR